MDLDEYLVRKRREFSAVKFAAKIGATPTAVSIWRRKEHTPTLRFALLIEKATEGQVTLRELLMEKEEKFLEKSLQKLKQNV